VAGRIPRAAPFWRYNFDEVADGRRVDRAKKGKLVFRRHGVSLFKPFEMLLAPIAE
jgi:hypothetical protein